jgi:hypothetical protein
MSGRGVLDGHEIKLIFVSMARRSGPAGFTFTDLMDVLRWANNARVDETLLSMVLKGSLLVGWNEDEQDATFAPA